MKIFIDNQILDTEKTPVGIFASPEEAVDLVKAATEGRGLVYHSTKTLVNKVRDVLNVMEEEMRRDKMPETVIDLTHRE